MQLGTIEILHAVFQSPISERTRYVIGCESMPSETFLNVFPNGQHQHQKATGVNIDGDGKFFLCYVEDCFDPPCAIVRAEDAADAEERFVDECEWAQVSDADMDEEREDADNDETGYSYTGNGTRYDGETIKVYEVRCLTITPDC